MKFSPSSTSRALRAEIAAIKGRLAAAQTRLQAAQAAAATPPPSSAVPTDLEIERARLADLSGGTERQAELIAKRDAVQAAQADHRAAMAEAKREAMLAEAAVQHETESLAEARRLELAALSVAAADALPQAEAAYRSAFVGLRRSLAQLSAVQALVNASTRARTFESQGREGLSPFTFDGAGIDAPGMGCLAESNGRAPAEGQFRPPVVNVTPTEMRTEASGFLAVMLAQLRDEQEQA